MNQTNSFEGIAEFIAVVDSQTFSAAARKLAVSTSHVSRKVAALEQRLGVSLLSRTTRQVKLTQAGNQYYFKCCELLDGMLEANETVKEQQVQLEGVLRVSAAGEFAEEYIAPALLEFAKQHVNLHIDINFNSNLVNLVEEGIDFAIRYGQLADSSLIAKKLISRTMVAVASEQYLYEHGEPKHPKDLSKHSCLVANKDRWVFQKGNEKIEVKVSGKWRSNNVKSLLKACTQGFGICYLPASSYKELANNTTIKPILRPYCELQIPTWIVYANRRYLPARARLAIQYLSEKFADNNVIQSTRFTH